MIKVGDIVRLKSGGPPMLVVMFMGEERSLYCFWGKPDSIGVGIFAPETVDLMTIPACVIVDDRPGGVLIPCYTKEGRRFWNFLRRHAGLKREKP